MAPLLNLRLYLDVAGRERSLEIALDESQPGRVLYEAVAPKIGRDPDGFGLHLVRLEEPIHPGVTLSAYVLRSGDRLDVVDRHPSGPPVRGATWALRVVSGPAEGLLIAVPAGTFVLGREMGEVDLADSSISRRHAILRATRGDLTVEDAASTNGTEVNGVIIRALTPLGVGDRISVGESVLGVFKPAAVALPTHITYDQGALPVNRPPRVVTEPPARTFDVPTPPQTPPKRKLPILASLIPVVMGAVMYLAMKAMGYGNPMYLLFMAGSPIMAVFSWLSDRRSGRSDFTKRKKDFKARLDSLEGEIAEASRLAVAWRHDRHPAPEVVVEQALSLSPALWHRRPNNPDFLDLRLGLADQPSLLSTRTSGDGDETLAKQAADLAQRYGIDHGVPLPLVLRETPVIGITCPRHCSGDISRWLTVQLAVHHSPRDVAVAVIAPGAETEWDWVKWLPHVQALHSGRPTVATTDHAAQVLLDELRSLAVERQAAQETMISSTGSAFAPHVVVIVQPPLRLPAREVVGFLETVDTVGMSVLWFAEERIALPPPVRLVVEDSPHGASVTHAAGGKQVTGVVVDRLTAEQAAQAARALAPLIDSTKEAAGAAIPERIDLVDLFDPQPLSPAVVAERWRQSPNSLTAVIGAGAGRPVSIDIAKDGPHGLVAGTTGSGKSELLQTLVASLAITFPPDRVNFVLVDYKGGAAFKDCVRLPHTVGFVTDLDERLAERAITSLNAELRWRERVLAQGGYKDLAEMRHKTPAATPASLIIIVDEFAALKTEVPAFLDGVVDIAQRGRSLGVHLLLATQKPRGVISANVQANTNLRIALRVTDADESHDVLGRPDAARLSRHLPGRAFVKTGSTEVTEVQVAYVGGSSAQMAEAQPARTFRIPSSLAAEAVKRVSTGGPTHLAQMVMAAAAAAADLRIPEQRRPWLPPLPSMVDLQQLDPAAAASSEIPDVVCGVWDDTAHQAQSAYVLDLAHSGSALIYGTAGTGKTTVLRTIAAALARSCTPQEVIIYGLDFAGRALAPIGRLPHCGDVVYGDDLERVSRLIAMLGSIADERRARLSQVGASSAAEFRRLTGEPMPAVVTLVDGLAQLWDSLESLDRGVHFDALVHLIAEGRAAGLHFVLTADRRGAVPSALLGSIPRRILMRLANADEYVTLGARVPKESDKIPPGRGWVEQDEVQLAVLAEGGDPSGAAQARVLAHLGSTLGPYDPSSLPDPIRLLPDLFAAKDLVRPKAQDLRIPIGLEERRLAPALVDLGRAPSFLVVGPPASGRSTALRTLALGLRHSFPDLEAYLFGARRSSLHEETWWKAAARTTTEVETLAGLLSGRLTEREAAPPKLPLLIVIDDADPLTEGRLATVIDGIVTQARDANAIVAAAMSTFRAARSFSGWPQVLRQQRSGLILQPDEEADGDVFQIRLPRRAALSLPAGRGYLIQAAVTTLVQVAV